MQELKRVAGVFGLSKLQDICDNYISDQDFLNPSIGTYLNDETGKVMKELYFNKRNNADVIFHVEGNFVNNHKKILKFCCTVILSSVVWEYFHSNIY